MMLCMRLRHHSKGTSSVRDPTATKISEIVAAKLRGYVWSSVPQYPAPEELVFGTKSTVCNLSQSFKYFPIVTEKHSGSVVCPLKYWNK